MMKLYIYSIEDNRHLATITGETNAACEAALADNFNVDEIGATYSPAFGSAEGLVENPEAREIGGGGEL